MFTVYVKTVNDNLNFDEQILEAAKSITNAAGALIKAATAAQKELVSQGKVRLCLRIYLSIRFFSIFTCTHTHTHRGNIRLASFHHLMMSFPLYFVIRLIDIKTI